MGSVNLESMVKFLNSNKLSREYNVNGGILDAKKTKDLFTQIEFSKDSFESADSMKKLSCDNYPNYQIIKGMPGSVFGDQFGYDMRKNIENGMYDYYAGKISEEDVRNLFEDCCKDMRIYRTQQCQTSGQNEKDNRQIISEVYEVFCKANQRAAKYQNILEGEAINRNYQNGVTNDFVYYNADYYYKCEDMRKIFGEMTERMTDQWELPKIDVDEIEKNTKYTLDGRFDFNSNWNVLYRNNISRGSMIDPSMAPPKDFKFFYKEQPYLNDKDMKREWTGIVIFECGAYKKEVEVPFKVPTGGTQWIDEHKVNLNKLIVLSKKDSESYEAYNKFLGNFEIFTRVYASITGINNKFD